MTDFVCFCVATARWLRLDACEAGAGNMRRLGVVVLGAARYVTEKILDRLRRTPLFTASVDAARRTLPTPVFTWLSWQTVRHLRGTPREVFAQIYRRNIWGYQETASGSGSTLQYTEKLRQDLPGLLTDLGIRTLLDVPCGDFHWMSHMELPVERYIGCDIVPELIETARSRHGRPDREFRTIDLCNDPLPDADLLLCRDCLIHLSEEMNLLALANILGSSVRYLLTTTYPNGKNRSIRNGNWFTLNLCAPPYDFPPPVRVIDDWLPPFPRRQLALWDVESLRQARGDLLRPRHDRRGATTEVG
jgi:SAM-dependent methyltransferase